MKISDKTPIILYMATYPPRECGIATFSRDLIKAIDKNLSPIVRSRILAMNNDVTNIYDYPKEVILQISDSDVQEYIDAAETINLAPSIRLLNIQHEFGIFGENYGQNLIPFLRTLTKPVIITYHSVLPHPNNELRSVVRELSRRALCIIVMTGKAIDILREDYGIERDVVVIPHGIPTVSFSPAAAQKKKMGLGDRTIISSFGMLNPGKGCEYVIEALPSLVRKFPSLLYMIVGKTHPIVLKKEGERYRNLLEKKVKRLGLQGHVKFYNKYLELREIIKYLKATDIYISSGLDPNQITSGTLAYAMGCGRAVISTPFLHAQDIVSEERGLLVEFRNPRSFSGAILRLLTDEELRSRMEKNAYAYTRCMIWPNVALSYKRLFSKYVELPNTDKMTPPKVNYGHLLRLTDDFGIIQFAKGSSPNPAEGYTLDDNARAMIVSCMGYELDKDSTTLELTRKYLDFISYVQQKDGRLYNFVDRERRIDLTHWSDDAYGRAIWSLGKLLSQESIPREVKESAERIFLKALAAIDSVKSPRAVSFIIMGLYFYNSAKPSEKNIELIRQHAEHLMSLYKDHASDDWQWYEEYLTYSNSKLPESLFYAYLATREGRYLRVAESTLDFLSSATFNDGKFSPVGHNGWFYKDGSKEHFDQQPVEAGSMVQTLVLAYDVTKKEKYLDVAFGAFMWFLGKNVLNQVVYDESTGGCHDGLGEHSVNLNQGAESTLSYLIARLCLYRHFPQS